MVKIRRSCPYKSHNRNQEQSCTEDDLCPECWMDKDLEENEEMYQAMADVDLE